MHPRVRTSQGFAKPKSDRARAQPLGFSDVAGTDPSIDAVPVLNHEEVVGGLVRACNVHRAKHQTDIL